MQRLLKRVKDSRQATKNKKETWKIVCEGGEEVPLLKCIFLFFTMQQEAANNQKKIIETKWCDIMLGTNMHQTVFIPSFYASLCERSHQMIFQKMLSAYPEWKIISKSELWKFLMFFSSVSCGRSQPSQFFLTFHSPSSYWL